MLPTRAFFSFSRLTDAARHGEFNEWHQLDHRPENLVLPGVYHGDRWVRTPADRESALTPDNELAATEYVNMYVFREPFDTALADWLALAEHSIHWGRRPENEWTQRLMIGFFAVLKTYVSPRVLISVAALPFRPARGVHLTVRQTLDTAPSRLQDVAAWHDRVRLPELMSCPGVAGAWTFLADPAITPPIGEPVPKGLRVDLIYLDEEPTAAVVELDARTAALAAELDRPCDDVETVLFSGVLRTITPWEWDWFDAEA